MDSVLWFKLNITNLQVYLVIYYYKDKILLKFVIANGYISIQYIFIGREFLQINNWITFSFCIIHACKIFRILEFNNYVIN